MAKGNDVNAEVRRLKNRVDGMEAVERILFRVQVDSLAKAEQLRRFALDVGKAPPGRLAGAMTRLRWFVLDLPAFQKHPMTRANEAGRGQRVPGRTRGTSNSYGAGKQAGGRGRAGTTPGRGTPRR